MRQNDFDTNERPLYVIANTEEAKLLTSEKNHLRSLLRELVHKNGGSIEQLKRRNDITKIKIPLLQQKKFSVSNSRTNHGDVFLPSTSVHNRLSKSQMSNNNSLKSQMQNRTTKNRKSSISPVIIGEFDRFQEVTPKAYNYMSLVEIPQIKLVQQNFNNESSLDIKGSFFSSYSAQRRSRRNIEKILNSQNITTNSSTQESILVPIKEEYTDQKTNGQLSTYLQPAFSYSPMIRNTLIFGDTQYDNPFQFNKIKSNQYMSEILQKQSEIEKINQQQYKIPIKLKKELTNNRFLDINIGNTHERVKQEKQWSLKVNPNYFECMKEREKIQDMIIKRRRDREAKFNNKKRANY
ncbi:UNKNOWN [Stylonychia lemnae]|uniref:Uncharacterized protein n=1 Tax=Stylonychia lemnae TaxID=5949 RepID=A0A078A0T1_STYLE|nr:UNKNOWN [Stylonychia lemnae]|eukprot:CDW75073.1 UNKNOWN [Stylonychia lemnae]